MRRQLRWYGASPLHLLALLACFGLAGFAAVRLASSHPVAVAAWFGGAVIGHDLLLMPLYSLADRSAVAVLRHREPHLPAAPWINYLRVPAALSGLLLLVWFPLILRLRSPYHASTTLSADPYLGHWLAVTGALFLLSAIAFAFRLRGRPPAAGAGEGQQPAGQENPHDQEEQEEQEAERVADELARPAGEAAGVQRGTSSGQEKPTAEDPRPPAPVRDPADGPHEHQQATEPDRQSKPGTATNSNRTVRGFRLCLGGGPL